MKILDKVINHFETQRQLANALGVTEQVVTNWKSRGLPVGYAIPIEEATGGVITRYEVVTALYEEKQETT